ncbi:MAG: hypothetical protein ABI680_12305, partial [Chthoniobacteraceae bacterium]
MNSTASVSLTASRPDWVKDSAPPRVMRGMNSPSMIDMPLELTGKKIAVLMGGPGSERPVSLKSGEGVVDALRSLGAEVMAVDVNGSDFTVPDDVLVSFNVIHGTFGEDGQLQRLMRKRGLAFTGEDVAGS